MPYAFPIKVTDTDPEVGTFARMLEDITGASKVKAEEMDEERMAVVTVTKFECIFPRGLLLETLESEAQLKDMHDVRERRALIEVENGPKFEPIIVTLADDVVGRFVVSIELINGVAYVKAFNSDPTWEAAVNWNERDLPIPEDTESPEAVSDIHRKYLTLTEGR
jgi:hypothetical protein